MTGNVELLRGVLAVRETCAGCGKCVASKVGCQLGNGAYGVV